MEQKLTFDAYQILYFVLIQEYEHVYPGQSHRQKHTYHQYIQSTPEIYDFASQQESRRLRAQLLVGNIRSFPTI